MPRPTTKTELLTTANTHFEKLQKLIDSISEEQQGVEFCFEVTEKDKEAHWKRDKNLRDILIHLHEWHRLIINFANNNRESEEVVPFLPVPYTWKSYGGMNIEFWENHQSTSLETAKEMLSKSHDEVIKLIESFSNEELFTKAYFKWSGTTSVGAYFVSATSSHYDWAMKKLKRQVKALSK